MRFKAVVKAHIEERTVDTRTTCDVCGRDVDHADHMYHEEAVEIVARIGDVYPEGSHQTTYDVDVCGPCFLSKVIPALAAAGIKVREREAGSAEDGREWDRCEDADRLKACDS